jgi:YD repeat-containing protein
LAFDEETKLVPAIDQLHDVHLDYSKHVPPDEPIRASTTGRYEYHAEGNLISKVADGGETWRCQ